jgi:hypothetical protein
MAGYADEGVNGDPLQRMPDPEGFQRIPNPLALLSRRHFQPLVCPRGERQGVARVYNRPSTSPTPVGFEVWLTSRANSMARAGVRSVNDSYVSPARTCFCIVSSSASELKRYFGSASVGSK